jgi:hypothetical protein
VISDIPVELEYKEMSFGKSLIPKIQMTDALDNVVESLLGSEYGGLEYLNTGMYFKMDAREGLVDKINHIETYVNFKPIWDSRNLPYLYLITPEEKKTNRHDKEYVLEKIKKCSFELQQTLQSWVESNFEDKKGIKERLLDTLAKASNFFGK